MPDGTEESSAPDEPARQPPAGGDAADAKTADAKTADAKTADRSAARRIVPDRDPVLPNRSKEDQDVGWGELPRDQDDWYERERPPHHGT